MRCTTIPLLIALLSSWPATSVAQLSDQQFQAKQQASTVQVSMANNRLADSTRTTRVTFTNPADTSVDVWLKPFFSRPGTITMGGMTLPTPYEAIDDGGGSALDSAWLARWPSAVPWLTGFPQHVTLGPHEQRMLSIRVVPYPTLPAGDYKAQFTYIQSPLINITSRGGVADTTQGPMVHGVFMVTYHHDVAVGALPPQSLTLARATVRVTPAVLVLTDRTPTIPVTFTNPTDHAIPLWLAVDFPYVRQFNQLLWGAPDSVGDFIGRTVENGWHNVVPDAELWLGGFPQYFVLPPHARRTVSLQVVPYPYLPNGQFYARLRYVQASETPGTRAGGSVPVIPHGDVDVVYTKGPPLPPLTLMTPTIARRADGMLHACVTVHQAGDGFVGTLHMVVRDAAGRTVEGRARPGGPSRPWEITARVASRETILGRNTARPICATLPLVAPGHYVVQVEVFRLDDVDRGQPARALLPWVVPAASHPGA